MFARKTLAALRETVVYAIEDSSYSKDELSNIINYVAWMHGKTKALPWHKKIFIP